MLLRVHITRGAVRLSGITASGEPYAREERAANPFARANKLAMEQIVSHSRVCRITIDNAALIHASCGRTILSTALATRNSCPACGGDISLADVSFKEARCA